MKSLLLFSIIRKKPTVFIPLEDRSDKNKEVLVKVPIKPKMFLFDKNDICATVVVSADSV